MLFLIAFLLTLSFCGCKNANNKYTNSNLMIDEVSTFDVEYDGLIETIKNNGYSYEEVDVRTSENGEANSFGIININPNDDLDIIRTQIRHSHNKVFQVSVSYTITDESPIDTSDQLVKLYDIILKKIKPGAPEDFLKNIDKLSDDFYSKDYDDLRVSISYEEIIDVTVEVTFVCLDFSD